MIVATVGFVHGGLQWWGHIAWFRLQLAEPPVLWWALPADLIFWTFGASVVWALVAGFVAENERKGDRRRWWLGFPGLAIVAAVSLAVSYVASRQGMALYEDRVAIRSAILAPVEIVPDSRIAGLAVRCDMVRRPRSVRANDLIDRPTFHLVLDDNRRIRLGGVRGAGIGDLSQSDWLVAMREFTSFPLGVESRSSECVNRVVARFPEADRAFVRSLFGVSPMPPMEVTVCPPGGSREACVIVPVRPGPPVPRQAS